MGIIMQKDGANLFAATLFLLVSLILVQLFLVYPIPHFFPMLAMSIAVGYISFPSSVFVGQCHLLLGGKPTTFPSS